MSEAEVAPASAALESGELIDHGDLRACRSVIRRATPRWTWSADEFLGVCDETIVSARKGFDASRGSFGGRLQQRAKDRVARSLTRSRPSFERRNRPESLERLQLTGEEDQFTATLDGSFVAIEEWESIKAFLKCLEGRDRQIASMLAEGRSQGEIASDLSMNPRAVSRAVARIRPLATEHFQLRSRRPSAA